MDDTAAARPSPISADRDQEPRWRRLGTAHVHVAQLDAGRGGRQRLQTVGGDPETTGRAGAVQPVVEALLGGLDVGQRGPGFSSSAAIC